MKRVIYFFLLTSVAFSVNAKEGPHKTLNLLYSIQGDYTVSGMHNKEPNSDPQRYTRDLVDITNRYPGLHSGDFLFASVDINNRQTMINEIIAQWNSGALVNLMWHACSPVGSSPCQWEGGVIAELSDGQWNDLITDGTVLNGRWKTRVDEVAGFLQQLEDAGVEVMFRPFHEMNQGKFWWGGRPGENGTAKLYQLTYDYLVEEKGLENLVWTWNLQDFDTLASDIESYDPGPEYWDVLSLDMYWSDGQGYTEEKYNLIRDKADGRPFAIGEAEDLPSPPLFENGQSEWTFFMGWSELVFNNSDSKLNEIYSSPLVLTRDELPGWDDVSSEVFQAEDYTGNSAGVQDQTVEGASTEVVYMDPWEYTSYAPFEVPSDGEYILSFRVYTDAGTVLTVERAGEGVMDTVEVPATGGKWITVYKAFDLTAGPLALALKPTGDNPISVDWFAVPSLIEVLEIGSSSSSSSSESSSSVGAVGYPFTIEAESFSNMDGVVVEGGVVTISEWQWMSYPAVELPASGTHEISYRVKSSSASALQLEQAGAGVIDTVDIPNTGDEWQTVTQPVDLDGGEIAFALKVPPSSAAISIDWFSVDCSECSSSSSSESSESSSSSSSSDESSSSSSSEASSSIGEPGESGGGSSSIPFMVMLLLLLFKLVRIKDGSR